MATTRSKFIIGKKGDKFYWQLKVRGKIVANSAQGYSSARHARVAAEAVKNNAANAEVAANGK